MENKSKRPICVTVWAYFCIILNALSIVVSLLQNLLVDRWRVALPVALGMVNIYAIVLILKWQRVGFYLLLTSAVLAFVYNISSMGFFSYYLTGLLGPVFWFLILQAKLDDGIKCWTKLE